MREHYVAVAVLLSAWGCGNGGPMTTTETTGTTTTDGTTEGTTAETGTETTGCGELPPCDLCPGEMSALCGQPCPQGAAPCSNAIGDGMSCDAGLWACVVHPPLGLECNDVCTLTDGCSEVGCSSGLTLALEAAGDVLPVGAYELDIDVDGVAEDCAFTISDDPEACAIPPCVTDTSCNALYLLNDSPPSVALTFGVVATLGVTVTRDTIEVAQDSFAPAYGVFAPNGPGCEPACAQASAVLTIP